MFEVADIFRLHGAAYRARFGNRLLPSQTRAMRDIEACRTPYFGGHIKQCDNRECGRKVYVYHSCGNRSCPKCHRQQTERWLERQRARLLPTQHYLLTFTLPKELRTLAFAHQNKIYGLLMRCAAAALQKLADDPRYVGGRLGLMGVVHTWTRAMLYHPHVHFLATAGGFSRDGAEWIKAKNPAFLVPVDALSVIFRAKVCAALKKAGLLEQTPGIVWKKKWVVHCQPAGSGRRCSNIWEDTYSESPLQTTALSGSRMARSHSDIVITALRRSVTLRYLRSNLSADSSNTYFHEDAPRYAITEFGAALVASN